MGCVGSKVDDLPLVVRCRERTELIRVAADHRYNLASTHLLYFRSLKDVGEALRKFVDQEFLAEELDTAVLTFPEGKVEQKVGNKKINSNNVAGRSNKGSSNLNSGRLSDPHSLVDDCGEMHDSHVHLSLSSDSELSSFTSHNNIPDSPPINSQEEVYPPQQRAREEAYGYVANSNPPPQSVRAPYGYGANPNPPPPPPPQSAWAPYGYGIMKPPGIMYTPHQTDWAPYPYGMNVVDQPNWGGNSNSYAYYMKRSAPDIRTVIHGEEAYGYSSSYSSNPNGSEGGVFGFLTGSPRQEPTGPSYPPPMPTSSRWDFLNPFDGYDNGYSGYYSHTTYGYGSNASSPDFNEVREREGIPDLEEEQEETENEVFTEVHGEKKVNENINIKTNLDKNTSSEARDREAIPDLEQKSETEVFREAPREKKVNENIKKSFGKNNSEATPPQKGERSSGTKSTEERSTVVPPHGSEGSSRAAPPHGSEASLREVHVSDCSSSSLSSEGMIKTMPSKPTSEAPPSKNKEAPVQVKKEKSNPKTVVSDSGDNSYMERKEVSFDELSINDVESSKRSSMTTLSAHGTRDIQEVVGEIRDEFQVASSYGKEVALMLEVGKMPYQSNFTLLKEAFSRILCLLAPSLALSQLSWKQSETVDSRTMELARSYYEDTDVSIDRCTISSILEEIYTWEKKLYKEVKDEEKLRLDYEIMCKKLKFLDDHGAESSKIDSMHASNRKLLTKLNVHIRGIAVISRRIQKLRDEELQPQITKLIHGLTRMWKFMLKCHQKQFQAIMESKTQSLKANTGFRRDSRLQATIELEMELHTWWSYFEDWIKAQKSYVESLNGWLLQSIHNEPEETLDGIVPFSPAKIGAPPIFVMCNDWHQAMEAIKESGVSYAMRHFALNLRELWERQDEEQRYRLKAEYLAKNFNKRTKTFRVESGRLERDPDAVSDKSIVASESGVVSPHDDPKVDLGLMRKRLNEERARHKDAMKLVHNAACSSLQDGLVPIFKALEDFSSEALKAHEQVRLQSNGGQGS